MKIKFDEIPYYASLYPEEAEQDKGCFEVGEQAKKQGYLIIDYRALWTLDIHWSNTS